MRASGVNVTTFIAAQLRRPSGVAAPVMAIVLDRANRRINERAVERLAIRRDDEVLEIGFGGGGALARLLSATSGRVAGVELSAPMLRRARRRFRRELEHGRLELREASVAALPFDDATFDRVVTVNTIYFWPDHADGLREIARVLKPGGRVVIATVAKDQMDKRSFTAHGFTKFTEDELRQLLETAGFADVTVERDGPRVFTTGATG